VLEISELVPRHEDTPGRGSPGAGTGDLDQLADHLNNSPLNGSAASTDVLLIDNQALLRDRLAQWLAADARLRIIRHINAGLGRVDEASGRVRDVVLMDLQLPRIAALDPVIGPNPDSSTILVLVLAADFDKEAAGNPPGNASHAIGPYDTPESFVSLLLRLHAGTSAVALPRRAVISKRELLVLQQVAAGRSNKQIARLLEISQKTVRNHMSRIFHKLGARNRTEAVMNAMRLGLLIV
jgi:DNA-binding NarL/FixJ family response regulator